MLWLPRNLALPSCTLSETSSRWLQLPLYERIPLRALHPLLLLPLKACPPLSLSASVFGPRFYLTFGFRNRLLLGTFRSLNSDILPGHYPDLADYFLFLSSSTFSFVVHVRQKLDTVPAKGLLGKGRMGDLLYKFLMAPSTWLIVRTLSNQSKWGRESF